MSLAMVVFGAGAWGCGGGKSCTLKACPKTGVDVVFSRSLELNATYEVDIEADGVASVCTVADGLTSGCLSTAIWTPPTEATVTLSGQVLPSGGFAGVSVMGHPSRLVLTLRRGTDVFGTAESNSVQYAEIENNGAGCGTCRVATLALDVP